MKIEINIDDELIQRIRCFFSRKRVIIAIISGLITTAMILKAASYNFHEFTSGSVISSSDVNENFSILKSRICPVGSIMPFAGQKSKIPDGWLICDGTAVDRSTYSDLYNVIGDSWGYGDGSSTFNLPDLRGLFLRGVDESSINDSDSGSRTAKLSGGNTGSSVGSYQSDAIRNITGTLIQQGNRAGINSSSGSFYNGTVNTNYAYFDDSGTHVPTNIYFDASRVVPTGSDNRPKNAYVYYIIKVN